MKSKKEYKEKGMIEPSSILSNNASQMRGKTHLMIQRNDESTY